MEVERQLMYNGQFILFMTNGPVPVDDEQAARELIDGQTSV